MREAELPSFYKKMVFKDKVENIISEALLDKAAIFLIDFKITDNFKIIVTIDSDNGVTLQDCIDLSRTIENNLDREDQDFLLEVASVGVGSPLKIKRQYIKNIGRKLIVKLVDSTIEAELVDANDDFISLEWESKEPKKIGKGKELVKKKQEIPYTEIKEAIVTVTFN